MLILYGKPPKYIEIHPSISIIVFFIHAFILQSIQNRTGYRIWTISEGYVPIVKPHKIFESIGLDGAVQHPRASTKFNSYDRAFKTTKGFFAEREELRLNILLPKGPLTYEKVSSFALESRVFRTLSHENVLTHYSLLRYSCINNNNFIFCCF